MKRSFVILFVCVSLFGVLVACGGGGSKSSTESSGSSGGSGDSTLSKPLFSYNDSPASPTFSLSVTYSEPPENLTGYYVRVVYGSNTLFVYFPGATAERTLYLNVSQSFTYGFGDYSISVIPEIDSTRTDTRASSGRLIEYQPLTYLTSRSLDHPSKTLDRVSSVAFQSGKVYIADLFKSSVFVYPLSSSVLQAPDSTSLPVGSGYHVAGLSFEDSNTLWVSTQENRLKRFSAINSGPVSITSSNFTLSVSDSTYRPVAVYKNTSSPLNVSVYVADNASSPKRVKFYTYSNSLSSATDLFTSLSLQNISDIKIGLVGDSSKKILAVSDSTAGKVYLFDVDNSHALIQTLDGDASMSGDTFNFSTGVAFVGNRLYVSDRNHHRVLVYLYNELSEQFVLVRQFGSNGTQPGQFIYPSFMGVDSVTKRLFLAQEQTTNTNVIDKVHVFISE